ncbi:MAG: hypothetical protein R2862_03080 [Thermoanaerobaculia bacterium]
MGRRAAAPGRRIDDGGEEEAVLAAFALAGGPIGRFWSAPRHPDRFGEAWELARAVFPAAFAARPAAGTGPPSSCSTRSASSPRSTGTPPPPSSAGHWRRPAATT